MATDNYTPKRVKPESSPERRRATQVVVAVSVVSAVAAIFAPVTLTGSPIVDGIERFVVVGLVTFTGAHGRRWSWLVSGAVLLIPARDVSLGLVLAALLVTLAASRSRGRSKVSGVVIAALSSNAVFWYPGMSPGWVPMLCGFVGLSIIFVSGYANVRRPGRRAIRSVLLTGAAVLVVAVLGTAYAALSTQADLQDGTTAARSALRHVEDGNTDQATLQLERARSHLRRADSQLGWTMFPARLVPSLAQHVEAVEVAVTQGRKVAEAADSLLASADYDDLRYDGRIDLDQIAALAPGAMEVRQVLTEAETRMDEIGRSWLLPPLRNRIGEFQTEIAGVRHNADLAADLLELAPVLFGEDGPEHYLIAFLTPAELRGAGGFIGNYAELTALRGDVELSESGRILNLIQATRAGSRTLDGPEEYIRRYGRFRPQYYLQDTTFSSHFPHSADVFSQLYPQAGGREVRAVVGIDPIGLAGLLEFTGPVDVEGLDEPLTSDNAVEILLREQYLSFEDEKADRKDVLEAATRATFEELTRASLPAPRRIGEVLGPIVRGRHIQLWSEHAAVQALFTRIGADGSVTVPAGGDGFTIAQQNAGNNKIDAYLQRAIRYTADVDVKTGRITGEIVVKLSNNVPSLDLPRDVVGNSRAAPVGTNVTWLNVFTPHAVTGATLDGEELLVAPSSEAGMNVYDTPVFHIPPGGSTTLVLRFSGALDLREGYHLKVTPQPMANPDEVEIVVSPVNGMFEGPGTVSGSLVFDDLLTEGLDLTLDAHL